MCISIEEVCRVPLLTLHHHLNTIGVHTYNITTKKKKNHETSLFLFYFFAF